MNQKLTKSLFRRYIECPNEFWLSVHHPELVESEISPDIAFRIRQGYEVERHFKDWILGRNVGEFQFQKKVESERLFAKFDVFADDGHIYEVKSSKYKDPGDSKYKNTREVNLYDVGFQVYVARESGLDVSKAFLVLLNGDYILGETLDLDQLFVIEDVTAEVEALQADIALRIEAAFELLAGEPEIDYANLCGNKLKCEYLKFAIPNFPERVVTDIPRLQGKKLAGLLEAGIFDLFDVPDDYDLTATQRDYVDFLKADVCQIDNGAIIEKLNELEYPIYFLDYETVNPCIPNIKGMSPLAQITFQYSLHIKVDASSELIHHEFLSDGSGNPPREIAENLASVIGEKGSVIVWYKAFEMTRNTEMATLHPEFAAFFESANSRVFDLYEIFQQKLYRDPAMKNNSIKSVLPVLVPELSYKELEIGNGGLAMSLWFDEVYKAKDEATKQKTLKNLREYCHLDTLAMVKILEVLQNP
jgi:Domain of unknown function(DUF2779)